ncbi:hypothetical protein [Thermovibrio sp.]
MKEFINDLVELVTDSHPNFNFSTSIDYSVLLEFVKKGIDAATLAWAIKKVCPADKVFSLYQIKGEVEELLLESGYLKKKREESLSVEPYLKIEKLIEFLNSLFDSLGVSGGRFVCRLRKLLEEEDLLKVERELYRLEEELFNYLMEVSPYYKECKERAERLVSKHAFYWNERVLEFTKREIVKECLRRRHGIPEFTAL